MSTKIERALFQTIHALSDIIGIRDPYTEQHQNHVSKLARLLGQQMGLPKSTVECLRICGTLHDIGKIGIPVEILMKPGKLTYKEFELIKEHSAIGKRILGNIEFPWPVADIVGQHHERLDGSGYPDGLKGDEILLEARIIAVTDVVESMMCDRPYRRGFGQGPALQEIEKNSGRLYDENVVATCLDLFHNHKELLEKEGF